jgi:hypothetical protein
MEHPRLPGLRERVSTLREKERTLRAELFGFAERDKAATRAAIHVVSHDLWNGLMECGVLRERVEALQEGRRLGEIFDVETVEEIVACEQRILNLYDANVTRMRAIVNAKVPR